MGCNVLPRPVFPLIPTVREFLANRHERLPRQGSILPVGIAVNGGIIPWRGPTPSNNLPTSSLTVLL